MPVKTPRMAGGRVDFPPTWGNSGEAASQGRIALRWVAPRGLSSGTFPPIYRGRSYAAGIARISTPTQSTSPEI